MLALKTPTNREAKVPFSCRLAPVVLGRLREHAQRRGHSTSTAGAILIQTAFALEDALAPFAPTIEHLMTRDRLTYAEAVAALVAAPVVTEVEEVR